MPKSTWNEIRDGGRPRRQRAGGDNGGEDGEEDEQDGDDDENNGHRNSNSNGKRAPDSKSAPLSGWDRVRQGDAINHGFVGTAPDGPSEFPRTREDLESRLSHRRNQYGDID